VNVRRSIAAAAVVLAAPVLSSCATGNFDAQTDQPYNPAVGVDARDGSVDVLNALIVSGSNGSGTLVSTLVNNDESKPDSLQKVAGSGKDGALKVTLGGPTSLPAGGMLNLANKGGVVVRGDRVVPGKFVEITFSFQRGDSVTLQAPVVANVAPYDQVKVPSGS
jgi:hypothetical protein